MKLPRVSIATIMAIIVIAAIDLAAIRALDGTNTLIGGLIAVGSIPMAGILVLGIPSLVRGFTGRAKIRPFQAGFEGVGWTGLLVFTVFAILFPGSVAGAIESAAQFLLSLIGLNTANASDPAWQLFGPFVLVLIIVLPQLVAALIGGWLNQRFKIKISIERRHATGLETMSPGGSRRQVSMRATNPDPAKA